MEYRKKIIALSTNNPNIQFGDIARQGKNNGLF